MKRKHVTLAILWEEYIADNPGGYRYSWFCELYRAWEAKLPVTMRQTYLAGEKLFVDYAGDRVPVIIDRLTGEIREAQIFVAVLGASELHLCPSDVDPGGRRIGLTPTAGRSLRSAACRIFWCRITPRRRRKLLIDAGVYDPSFEHDACGVGLVCAIDGQPRREVVELAIKALKAVWHRGAVDADGKTGDGAGILLGVPQDFFADQVRRTGHQLRPGPIAVGQIFLPRVDLGAQEAARTIVESEVLRFGFYSMAGARCR